MQTLSIPKRLASFEHMAKENFKSKIFQYITDQRLNPSYDDYLSLNLALQTGDIQMDKVMAWVMVNPRQNRKLFEIALYKGLDQLPQQVPELTEFFSIVEKKPDWYNEKKIKDAQKFNHKLGLNSVMVLRDLALMIGYLYPGFNQPLILTGALNKQVGRRMAETHKWWLDITEIDGFDRFNSGFTSTIYVRFIHSLVRYQLNKSKDWDRELWGEPINQYDQAMTNIAFSGVLLLGIRAIGIFPNKVETDSFLHFWRYAGWLMGIDEKWLVDSEKSGWKLLYWMQYAHPEADNSSITLGSSLSKEPFERKYKYLSVLQQKIAYRQHLEMNQFFIGRKKMKKLGLKPRTLSWYPIYLMAKNTVLYNGARHLKIIDHFLLKHGRAEQENNLLLYKEAGKQLASMHQ